VESVTHNGVICDYDDATHTYSIRNTRQKLISVTKMIQRFFPVFDADAVSIKCAGKGKYVGMSPYEIRQAWSLKANLAADDGTIMHDYCDAMIKNAEYKLPNDASDRAKKLVHVATRAIMQLIERFEFVDSEKIVFSPTLKCAGRIDLLMKDQNSGDILLLDWKQNEEIKKSNVWEYGFNPISHIQACNFNEYSLQLNIYQQILKKEGYFSKNVKYRRALIHITPDKFVPIPVLDMQDDVVNMLGAL
jgi:hypothetical protein